MNIGIVGLGLIGGSVARAYRAYSDKNSLDFKIFGHDINKPILDFAIMSGVLDGNLDAEAIKKCDLIFIGLYPDESIAYLNENADKFSPTALVIDLCGTKSEICKVGFELAKKYGFTFVGGHPMAGTHNSGYKYSRANMFAGAPMVIVPPSFDDIELLGKVRSLLSPLGFGRYSVTSAEEHDRLIAFTSQLAHVVSNAYVKSPTAREHKGFSAGSYKDMTRVAWLNEVMWTELFFENKDPLLFEIDCIINSLSEYRDALISDDKEKMRNPLRDGRIAKEEIDK